MILAAMSIEAHNLSFSSEPSADPGSFGFAADSSFFFTVAARSR